MYTIRISGINNKNSYYAIVKLFSEYGEIKSSNNYIPYGILITYEDKNSALKALILNNTIFKQQKIKVELHDNTKHIAAILHIKNLNISPRQLATLLIKYGKIKDIKLLKNKDIEIEYENIYHAENVHHNINNIFNDNVISNISYIETPKNDKYYSLSKLDKYTNKEKYYKIIDWLNQYEKSENNNVIFNIPENITIPFKFIKFLTTLSKIIYPNETYTLNFFVKNNNILINYEIRIYIYNANIKLINIRNINTDKNLMKFEFIKQIKNIIYNKISKIISDNNDLTEILQIFSQFSYDNKINLIILNKNKRNELFKYTEKINNIIDLSGKLKISNIIDSSGELITTNIIDSKVNIFNILPLNLEKTQLKKKLKIKLLVKSQENNNIYISNLMMQMDNSLNKIRLLLNKNLELKTYVVNITNIKLINIIIKKEIISIYIVLNMEYIINEDYFETIGFLKNQILNICGTNRYNENELYDIAKTLNVDISSLNNKKEICEYLNNIIINLSYSDFV